jgi:hypothetical protein
MFWPLPGPQPARGQLERGESSYLSARGPRVSTMNMPQGMLDTCHPGSGTLSAGGSDSGENWQISQNGAAPLQAPFQSATMP